MNTGVGIRAIGQSHRASRNAINYALGRKAAANDRLVELRDSATHVDQKRVTVVDYSLHRKTAANDSVLKIRGSATHVGRKRATVGDYSLHRQTAVDDRFVELRDSATHVGRKRAEYALGLKAVANDSVFEVRDSAAQGDWKRAHDELVRLAKERAGLDWHEGRSLLSALRSQAHRKIGYASFEEYIERLFGYSPRFTKEKVRVAEALEVLTEMAQALKDGKSAGRRSARSRGSRRRGRRPNGSKPHTAEACDKSSGWSRAENPAMGPMTPPTRPIGGT